jgi:hypothetical protein
MTPRQDFHPLQAEEIARAFRTEGVDYLFIGKSGAILSELIAERCQEKIVTSARWCESVFLRTNS